MFAKPRHLVSSWCLVSLAICLVGCSGKAVPTLADVNNTNIKKVRGAYGLFQINHNLAGPESEEKFKQYLKNDAGAKVKLERMGVMPEMIDGIFVSERDGKPFNIRYGVNGLGDHALVFEAEGVDDKRLVAFIEPREVDDAEYDQLWNAKPPKKRRQEPDEMSKAFD